MLEEVGRRKRRSTRCLTGVPVRCLLGCSHACTGRAPSTLAVGDAADFDMGDLHSKRIYDLCVDVPVRPTRAYFAAPVRQGPQASKQARKHRPLRGGGCKARPDLRLRTAVCSADRVESLVLQGRIIIDRRTPCICVWLAGTLSGCE